MRAAERGADRYRRVHTRRLGRPARSLSDLAARGGGMSFVREIVKNASIAVGVADTIEELSALHRPGCAAVIWRRQPLTGVQSWIDGLDPDVLPRAWVILRPDAVRDAALEVCDASGIPAGPERDRFVDDIAALADIFAGLIKARWLRLRSC
ncbi:DUF1826 domain-containing protein [Rhodothalassium salexigens]|uniref:DUF1826 domain-containing protein n=1 Tax=Rhodothalassium salexigens TaxID=1086 RepID=UPI003C74C357